jgi:hypothetical protein
MSSPTAITEKEQMWAGWTGTSALKKMIGIFSQPISITSFPIKALGLGKFGFDDL